MRRRLLWVIGVTLLAAMVLGYWQWYRPTRYAVSIGAGMLAKQMCSCLFVAEREVEACHGDQLASLAPIQFEVQDEPQGVRAFVPGLGERHATYREGLGCTLQ